MTTAMAMTINSEEEIENIGRNLLLQESYQMGVERNGTRGG